MSWLRRRTPRLPEIAVVWERLEREQEEDGTRLITRQLREAGERDLEMVDVPEDLHSFAADLLLRLADRVSGERPQRDGESIGGALVAETQAAIHIVTLRLVRRSIEPGSAELFRVVDYEAPAGSRFPRRLMATHLALLAAEIAKPNQREWLYRRSIEMFPGEAARDDGRFEFDRGENCQNYVAWDGLGELLFKQGKVEEGRAALRSAMERCPAWANDFSSHLEASVTEHPSLRRDPVIAFWLDYAKSRLQ